MEDNSCVLNHLTLIAKYCIYKCKLNSVNPSLRVYKTKIQDVYQVEKKIAAKRNKLTKQFQKWEKFLPNVGLYSPRGVTPISSDGDDQMVAKIKTQKNRSTKI